MLAPPVRVIEVNGVSIAVDDRNSTQSGVALVLLHGFTDHRGRAGSTNTEDPATYTFDHLAADAAALVDELALDRFDLLGHSMGGIVAMRYVLDHPSRVRSLILMGTSATPITAIPKEWVERTVAMGRADGMEAVGEMIVGFASNNPTLRRPLGIGSSIDFERSTLRWTWRPSRRWPVSFMTTHRCSTACVTS